MAAEDAVSHKSRQRSPKKQLKSRLQTLQKMRLKKSRETKWPHLFIPEGLQQQPGATEEEGGLTLVFCLSLLHAHCRQPPQGKMQQKQCGIRFVRLALPMALHLNALNSVLCP